MAKLIKDSVFLLVLSSVVSGFRQARSLAIPPHLTHEGARRLLRCFSAGPNSHSWIKLSVHRNAVQSNTVRNGEPSEGVLSSYSKNSTVRDPLLLKVVSCKLDIN